MAGEPTGNQPETVYGPFHRLEADLTQDAATAVRQLLSGEVWGKCEPFGLLPKVKAYRGPLREGDSGVEFWAFQAPDHPHGPRGHWSSPSKYVTIDHETETAKLSVAFVRVTQDLLEALP